MSSIDRTCTNCGNDSWSVVLEQSYPDTRRDRDQTIKTVYECEECGAEGRHFAYNNGDGTDTYSGAMR